MPLTGEARRAYDLSRYREFKARLAEIKSVPCADCGKRFPPYVMDFHHTDRNKEFGVASGKNRNFNKVLTEIAKCVILCANCHRIREYASGQAPSFGAR